MIKFKGVRQKEKMDCAAACLCTVSKFYKKNISLEFTKEMLKTDIYGASVYGITETANKIGFTAEALEGSLAELEKGIDTKEIAVPFIAHFKYEDGLNHFVVVYKIKKDKIYYFNPEKGNELMEKKLFDKVWTGVIIDIKDADFDNELLIKNDDIIKLFFKKKYPLIVIIIFSILILSMSILSVLFYRWFIDYFILNQNLNFKNTNITDFIFKNIIVFMSILITIYTLQVIVNFFRGYFLINLSKYVSEKIYELFIIKILSLTNYYFNNNKTGDILSRYKSILEIPNLISKTIVSAILDSIGVFIGAIVLYKVSIDLFSLTIIMLFLYIIIVVIFIPILKKLNKELLTKEAEGMTFLNEVIDGNQTIRTNQIEEEVNKKFLKKNKAMLKVWKKANLSVLISSSLINFIENVVFLLILWRGSFLVSEGVITLGELISFESLSLMFISPVKNLLNIQNEIQELDVLMSRINEILNNYGEKYYWKKEKRQKFEVGSIRYENISFSYNNREEVFKKLNLHIPHNKIIGLTAANGYGKTTMLKLLATTLKPDSGQITINDVNIEEYPLPELRKEIIYVPSNPFILSGSVKENLFLYNAKVNESIQNDILETLEISSIGKEISEEGFLILEKGINLSSGQKQKISLARSLLRNPKILILDEASSNLDQTSEKELYKLLRRRFKETTVISTYHNQNTSDYFDQIISIE